MVTGKFLLEILTTAMYEDSRIMFREYIQNSCDSIRTAVKEGLIKSINDARIDIKVNKEKRCIEFVDNGGGLSRDVFENKLRDIANSDKEPDKDMGFRGIGRLCGLAYCTQLQFISTTSGDTTVCVSTWDAEKMRDMLEDNKKYSADEVLNEITQVEYQENVAGIDEHYFKVVMSGIRSESEELLETSNIRSYLSFIAPVPYNTKFLFYNKIHDHAEELGDTIEEYRVYVNDEQIFKEYSPRIYRPNGEIQDTIKEVEFQDFRDDDGTLLAWMWFGVSTFDGSIYVCEKNLHRGLRLRKSNIQIGTEDTLRRLHKEPRGNGYFIGELFAVHKDLIPNARRDYFNESPVCEQFENKVKRYFIDTLHKVYYSASNARSECKDIVDYNKEINKFKETQQKGFSGSFERSQAEERLKEKKEKADLARKKIEKYNKVAQTDVNPLIHKVREIVQNTVLNKDVLKTESKNLQIQDENNTQPNKPRYLTDSLSSYDRKTRKVVSIIYDVIQQNAPEIATDLIAKIQDALLNAQKD